MRGARKNNFFITLPSTLNAVLLVWLLVSSGLFNLHVSFWWVCKGPPHSCWLLYTDHSCCCPSFSHQSVRDAGRILCSPSFQIGNIFHQRHPPNSPVWNHLKHTNLLQDGSSWKTKQDKKWPDETSMLLLHILPENHDVEFQFFRYFWGVFVPQMIAKKYRE